MATFGTSILTRSLRSLSASINRCQLTVCIQKQLSSLEQYKYDTAENLHRVERLNTGLHRQQATELWTVQIRNYSHAKNRGKKGSNKHKPEHVVDIESDDVHGLIDFEKYEQDLQKLLEELKHDFIQKLALKTSAGSFDKFNIATNDGNFPLNQIAGIQQKSPTLVVLNLNQYMKYVPNVMDALRNSGMNLNPQQEGQATIYIIISKVSHEHRELLAKNAKAMFNESKDKMNNVFTAAMKKISKQKDVNLKKTLEQKLLQEKNKVQKDAETLMKAKQKELLGS